MNRPIQPPTLDQFDYRRLCEQSNHDNVSAYSVNCLCSQKDVKSYRQWMDLKRGGHRLSFISGGGSKGRS